MTEPYCDMPWDVYLDWLQDQGNEDLRFICAACFITSDEYRFYHDWHEDVGLGEGYYDRTYNVESLELHHNDRLHVSYGAGSIFIGSNIDYMRGDGSI